MDPDFDDECQVNVIQEFSVVKCCFCYSNIFDFKYEGFFAFTSMFDQGK